MEDPLSIAGPITVARPRGAHRFDAFSPKLARRVMFYQRPAPWNSGCCWKPIRQSLRFANGLAMHRSMVAAVSPISGFAMVIAKNWSFLTMQDPRARHRLRICGKEGLDLAGAGGPEARDGGPPLPAARNAHGEICQGPDIGRIQGPNRALR